LSQAVDIEMNTGIMERWNNGVRTISILPIFHYSFEIAVINSKMKPLLLKTSC
jgi:hypothetical protein